MSGPLDGVRVVDLANMLESLITDEQLAATGFFSVEEHPTEGRLRQMAYPSTWSVTQPGATRPVPRAGEHSIEVLRELGYSKERIETLIHSGATKAAAAADTPTGSLTRQET